MVSKNLFTSNFKKIGLFLFLFLVIGELFIRVDIYLSMLSKENIIEVKEVSLSKEHSKAKIMVLGDSFIYGGGLSSDKKVSSRLMQTKNIEVADLSRPSNNTIDNYNTFNTYIDSIKPELVVLGYHVNDVLGGISMDKVNLLTGNEDAQPVNDIKELQVEKKESSAKALVKAIYKSWKSLGFVSSNLQNTLKVNYGILTPGGDQYKISNELYLDNSKDWQTSMQLLAKIKADCDQRDIQFVILLFTDFNTLKSNTIHKKPLNALTTFCTKENISCINTREIFIDSPINDLVISRYDGHANEKVHNILADTIYNYYKKVVPN